MHKFDYNSSMWYGTLVYLQAQKEMEMKHWTLEQWQLAATSLYATLDGPRLLAVEACQAALVTVEKVGLAPGNEEAERLLMRQLEWAIAANKEIGEQQEKTNET